MKTKEINSDKKNYNFTSRGSSMKPIDYFNSKSINSFYLKPIDWPLTHRFW